MEGKLKSWNTDRGFGFIAPTNGGADVFVHIKALPRDGSRPIVGEVLQFDVDTDRDGRKRAVNVRRPGLRATASPIRKSAGDGRSGRNLLSAVLPFVVFVALASYGYQRFQEYSGKSARTEDSLAGFQGEFTEPDVTSEVFKCDGRTRCPQMRSCAEARHFLQHCPGVQMDGNHDGEPCEQQWCQ
ncbi:MAG: cold shock domain-containing protein [Steroidobacteraceae bacterium]